MTEYRVLLDSAAWLAYFFTGKPEIKEIIESGRHEIISSAISILEIRRKLLQEKYSGNEIEKALEFVKSRSAIKDVTEQICEKAAEDCMKEKFHTADAIIYRTAADNSATIVTLDAHFKGKPNATVL